MSGVISDEGHHCADPRVYRNVLKGLSSKYVHPAIHSHFLYNFILDRLQDRMTIFKKQTLKTRNEKTRAAELTLRQSIYPLALVTILFFLWVCNSSLRIPTDLTRTQGFSYGLLDTLNKHFQNTLGITRSRSSGLQAAYFGYIDPIRSSIQMKILMLLSARTLSQVSGMQTGSSVTTDTNLFLFGASVSTE